jgi:hypothetical protein
VPNEYFFFFYCETVTEVQNQIEYLKSKIPTLISLIFHSTTTNETEMYIPTPLPQPYTPVSSEWISPLPAPVPMIHQPPIGAHVFEKAACQAMSENGHLPSCADVLSYDVYGADAVSFSRHLLIVFVSSIWD